MIWIGIGGILGAVIRYSCGKWMSAFDSFPWGTWIVNFSGSFLFGVLFTLHMKGHLPNWLWLLTVPGFCGAYTTFSAFGYEAVLLLKNQHAAQCIAYVLTTVGLGMLAASAGLWLGGIM